MQLSSEDLIKILEDNRTLFASMVQHVMPQEQYKGISNACFTPGTAAFYIVNAVCHTLSVAMAREMAHHPNTSIRFTHTLPLPVYANANSAIQTVRETIVESIKQLAIVKCPFCGNHHHEDHHVEGKTYNCYACGQQFEMLNGSAIPIT